jgi:hypothetical protein
MKSMKSLFLISSLALSIQAASGYDVVNRYKIIDDKLKTEQMLRPFGHDFFLDIGGALDPDVMNVIKDVDNATKFSGTNLQKLNNATTILTKYDKTEQTVKVNLAVGIPIFSFSAWDVKVQPNVRAFVDFGINLGIRTDVLTLADLLKQFPVAVPADLSTAINSLAPSTDVVVWCLDAAHGMSVSTKLFCSTLPTGTYLIPSGLVPNMSLFAKLDGKVGLFNDYTYGEHFFGNLNLYGLVRSDIEQIMTKDMIANGAKVELPKKSNTEGTMQMDYRLGYQNSNYTTFVSVEELKLSKIKERDQASRAQMYGYDPLIRVHGDATYKYSAFSLQPFAGFHKRSGYTLSDGVYGGAAVGAHVWGERIGVQLRGMLDKQYLTITPRFKLWLMQLEYSLKSPVKSTDGDVKLSAIHSVDFRLFF